MSRAFNSIWFVFAPCLLRTRNLRDACLKAVICATLSNALMQWIKHWPSTRKRKPNSEKAPQKPLDPSLCTSRGQSIVVFLHFRESENKLKAHFSIRESRSLHHSLSRKEPFMWRLHSVLSSPTLKFPVRTLALLLLSFDCQDMLADAQYLIKYRQSHVYRQALLSGSQPPTGYSSHEKPTKGTDRNGGWTRSKQVVGQSFREIRLHFGVLPASTKT